VPLPQPAEASTDAVVKASAATTTAFWRAVASSMPEPPSYEEMEAYASATASTATAAAVAAASIANSDATARLFAAHRAAQRRMAIEPATGAANAETATDAAASAGTAAKPRRRVTFTSAVEPYQPGTATSPVLIDQGGDEGSETQREQRAADRAARVRASARAPTGDGIVHVTATPTAATADASTSTDAAAGPAVVQCAGVTAKGGRCKVCSVGSSAPAFISAPLRNGARCCTIHRGQ